MEIEVTALLPIVAFPLLGIAPLGKVAAPYAADVIFLFMGGFIIGARDQRWGLDRRIAFFTLRLVGARPGAIIGGIHGGHRVPQHVGLEYRVRGDDGADRAVASSTWCCAAAPATA